MRRTAIPARGLDIQADRGWDLWLAAAGARRTGLVWFDPRPLSRYRVHSAQASGLIRPELASDSTFRGLVWCWDELIADPAYAEEAAELRSLVSTERAKWALASMRTGQKAGALELSTAAMSLAPTSAIRAVHAAALLNSKAPGRFGQRALALVVSCRDRLAQIRGDKLSAGANYE
jgi:hypothetical protein